MRVQNHLPIRFVKKCEGVGGTLRRREPGGALRQNVGGQCAAYVLPVVPRRADDVAGGALDAPVRPAPQRWRRPDPDEREGVGNKLRLDALVQRRARGERRADVDLQQPRLQLVVHQHVEAVHLEAARAVHAARAPRGPSPVLLLERLAPRVLHGALDGDQRLDDEVLDAVEHRAVVELVPLEVGAELRQRPLRGRPLLRARAVLLVAAGAIPVLDERR
mmetsp:Transcript_74410/g.210183  ORF Transcript_74410/g.210183 Transcript_74410/m.210183 type:complete len:219 (-) Transcript_74410:1129-1785(-)